MLGIKAVIKQWFRLPYWGIVSVLLLSACSRSTPPPHEGISLQLTLDFIAACQRHDTIAALNSLERLASVVNDPEQIEPMQVYLRNQQRLTIASENIREHNWSAALTELQTNNPYVTNVQVRQLQQQVSDLKAVSDYCQQLPFTQAAVATKSFTTLPRPSHWPAAKDYAAWYNQQNKQVKQLAQRERERQLQQRLQAMDRALLQSAFDHAAWHAQVARLDPHHPVVGVLHDVPLTENPFSGWTPTAAMTRADEVRLWLALQHAWDIEATKALATALRDWQPQTDAGAGVRIYGLLQTQQVSRALQALQRLQQKHPGMALEKFAQPLNNALTAIRLSPAAPTLASLATYMASVLTGPAE